MASFSGVPDQKWKQGQCYWWGWRFQRPEKQNKRCFKELAILCIISLPVMQRHQLWLKLLVGMK